MNYSNPKYFDNMVSMIYSRRGIPAGLTHMSKSYVIVFPLRTIAEKTEKIVTEKTKFELVPKKHNSVTDASLIELGFDHKHPMISQAILDDEAYLYIPKWRPTKLKPYPPLRCRLFDRNLLDIVLYPFTKNIGLVLPLEIIDDNADYLILSSKVVEPNIHIDLFRKELEKYESS